MLLLVYFAHAVVHSWPLTGSLNHLVTAIQCIPKCEQHTLCFSYCVVVKPDDAMNFTQYWFFYMFHT